MNFDDSSSFDTCSKNVLFCWLVILGAQPVQIVKKAENIKVSITEDKVLGLGTSKG